MMDARRLIELGELLIDGELTPAEAAELRAHLESDPSAIAALHAAAQEHVLCRAALRPADTALIAERARRMMDSWRPASGAVAAAQVFARVDRRRRADAWRRWTGLAAAALLVMAGWWLVRAGRGAATDADAPRVVAMSGEVRRADGTAPKPGEVLAVDGVVEVGGASDATLAWSDGTTIRIGAGSHLVRLRGGSQRVRLDRGAVVVEASHRPADAAMEIVCPDAVTRVVGTKFEVAVADGHARLTVSDGVVRLTRAFDGVSSLVGAGQQASAITLPLPTPLLMSTEQLAAVRQAIAAGREPWAGSWAALHRREAALLTPAPAPPAEMVVPAYQDDQPAHSAAREIVADGTKPALSLALIARLGDDPRAAAASVARIHAWLPVRVSGPDSDVVVSDAAIALIQAADLLRVTPAWTAEDSAALEAWMRDRYAPAAQRLLANPMADARWRGTAAAMTVAAWHGDRAEVRALMARVRSDIAGEFTAKSLKRMLPGPGEDRELVQDLLLALQCADLARLAADDDTPPPPEWATAVEGFLALYARTQPVDAEKTFFMRALAGSGPWRSPAAQRFVVGAEPDLRIAFGWYYPDLTAQDPRRH